MGTCSSKVSILEDRPPAPRVAFAENKGHNINKSTVAPIEENVQSAASHKSGITSDNMGGELIPHKEEISDRITSLNGQQLRNSFSMVSIFTNWRCTVTVCLETSSRIKC